MNREAYPPCLLFALLNDLLHKQIKLSYYQSTFMFTPLPVSLCYNDSIYVDD